MFHDQARVKTLPNPVYAHAQNDWLCNPNRLKYANKLKVEYLYGVIYKPGLKKPGFGKDPKPKLTT